MGKTFTLILCIVSICISSTLLAFEVDSRDPGEKMVEVCFNGVDDDGDGLIDGADPDCCDALGNGQPFLVAGDAEAYGTNCYRISRDTRYLSGAAWFQSRIDLNFGFFFEFDLYMGDKDEGADGLSFVIHDSPAGFAAFGREGSGLGYDGVRPSVAIEFDTYFNGFPLRDIPEDHTSITGNGQPQNIINNEGVVCTFPDCRDIEDQNEYRISIRWDPQAERLTVAFDGNIRATYEGDMVQEFFDGDPNVYIGLAGSTGLFFNEQRFCVVRLEVTRSEICGNGIDDNCNGLIDCEEIVCGRPNLTPQVISLCPDEAFGVDLTMFEDEMSPDDGFFSYFDASGNRISNPRSVTIEDGTEIRVNFTRSQFDCEGETSLTFSVEEEPELSSITTSVCANLAQLHDLTQFESLITQRRGTFRYMDSDGNLLLNPRQVAMSGDNEFRVFFVPNGSDCEYQTTINYTVYETPQLTPLVLDICPEQAGSQNLMALQSAITRLLGTFVFEDGRGREIADPMDYPVRNGEEITVIFKERETNCEARSTVVYNIYPTFMLNRQRVEICPEEANLQDLTLHEMAMTPLEGRFRYRNSSGSILRDPTRASVRDGEVFTVEFTNSETGCTAETTLEYTYLPTPEVNDLVIEICPYESQGQDLTANLTAITTEQGAFSFYSPRNQLIDDPNSVDVRHGDVFRVVFENRVSGCVNQGTITYLINPLPRVRSFSLQLCEPQALSQDLTRMEAVITEEVGTFEYYRRGTLLNNPQNVQVFDRDTFEVVFTNIETGCENTALLDFRVNPDIVLSPIDVDLCPYETEDYDLTQFELYLTTAPGSFLYFDPNGDPIQFPDRYDIVGGTSVRVVFTDGICGDETLINFNVFPLPELVAQEIFVCPTEFEQNLIELEPIITSEPGFFSYTDRDNQEVANPALVEINDGALYTATFLNDLTGCVNTTEIKYRFHSALWVEAEQDEEICIGESVQLDATSNGTTIEWSFQETRQSIGLGVAPTVSPSASQTYIVSATDENACVVEDSMTVLVSLLPEIDAGEDEAICLNESIQLLATGGAAYEWSPAATLSADSISNPLAFPETFSSYQVLGTDIFGCENTDSMSITVYPLPSTDLPRTFEICEGESVEIAASGSLPSYEWSTQGTESSIQVTPPVSEEFWVIPVSEDGCLGDTAYTWVEVYPLPLAIFDFTPENGILPVTVQFEDQSLFYSRLDWDFGDGFSSGEFSPDHVYTKEGRYRVSLQATNKAGCFDTTSIYILIENPYIHVPNAFTPNGDGINESFYYISRGYDDIFIQIFDRWGRLIVESNELNFKWDGTKEGQQVQEGVYVYRLTAKNPVLPTILRRGTITLIR
ncbi:MAG: gliding motility-associated C-terminal domain-containing protein [Bacteroidota bacterium]